MQAVRQGSLPHYRTLICMFFCTFHSRATEVTWAGHNMRLNFAFGSSSCLMLTPQSAMDPLSVDFHLSFVC